MVCLLPFFLNVMVQRRWLPATSPDQGRATAVVNTVSPASKQISQGLSPARALLGLVGTGVGLLLLVGVYDLVLPSLEGSADPELAAFGPWTVIQSALPIARGSDATVLAVSLALLGSMSVLYLLGLLVAGRQTASLRALALVLVVAAALSGVILFDPPARSADLDYYAFEGRTVVRYGQSPYQSAPSALAADSWYPILSPVWRDVRTGYGPSWLALTSAVDVVADRGGAQPDLAKTLSGLRALFVALNMGSVALIWALLSVLAPRRQLVGAIAYGWNPVVFLVGVEHNDVTMLFFALLGLWLHTRRRSSFAVGALVISALVKYYTLPLLIGYLLWQWRTQGWRKGLLLVGVAAIAGVAITAPFNLLAYLSNLPTYLSASGRAYYVAQTASFANGVLVLLCLFAIVRPSRFKQVISGGTFVLLIYLAAFSRDWFPWYLVSALGLAAVAGGGWLVAAVAASLSWLLSENEGTAYIAGLAQHWLAIDPSASLAFTAFAPAATAASVSVFASRVASHRRSWLGLAIVACGAITFGLLAPLSLTSHAVALSQPTGGRQAGPVIFDRAFEWDDWSSGVGVEQIGTPAGPAGPRSLCLTYTAPGGTFYAHHPGFQTNSQTTLSFLVLPSTTVSSLDLEVRGANDRALGKVSLASAIDPSRSVDGWKQVNIPLSRLGAKDQMVTGVLLRDLAAPSQAPACLQQFAFH